MISEKLEYIQACPMENLCFRDFASLRSGRDKFSAMGLPELLASICPSTDAIEDIMGKFPAVADQAKVLRWMGRGLSAEKAMRKVATDMEISRNAQAKAKGEWLPEWEERARVERERQAEYRRIEEHVEALEENAKWDACA